MFIKQACCKRFPVAYAFSPWMVATKLRLCLDARNSRYQIPCQVPVCFKESALYSDGSGLNGAVTYQLTVLDGDSDTCSNKSRFDMGLDRSNEFDDLEFSIGA